MKRAVMFVVLLCLAPASAFAQASIVGVVKDTSGGILPGVTVEASSPALIEKVRTAVSDGAGQYRIEDLRPGVYTVTFTLPGFTTLRREGVELTGSFAATINADLRIGAVEETITVTGESPIVDVQSSKRELTLGGETLTSLPTVRTYNALVNFVPGVVTSRNDVQTGPAIVQFPVHGGRANEGRLAVGGFSISNPPGGNQPPQYAADIANSQEVTFTTAAGLGESETGGVVINVIPKTGGNRFEGSTYISGTGEKFQSENFSDEFLAGWGLSRETPLSKVYDFSAALGGPIQKDRLWFFVNGRLQGSTRIITGLYYNLNANDPTKWTYAPDYSRPGFSDRTWENVAGRVTWQANQRNKFGGFWDVQAICRKCEGTTYGGSVLTGGSLITPEAVGARPVVPLGVQQLTWSSPVTNRLLLEGGWSHSYYDWSQPEREPSTRSLIRVVEQCSAGCPANGGIPNLTYRSMEWGDNYESQHEWRATAAFVTGAQSFKAGYIGTYFYEPWTTYNNDQSLIYRFNNGVPNQLTQLINPSGRTVNVRWNALFAQHQLTYGRVTMQAAVRYDRASSWFPQEQLGPARFLPTPIIVPASKGVDSYNDVTPRFGFAWDVFGNARTAVKASAGKYLDGVGTGGVYGSNPVSRIPTSVTRSWTDSNTNYVADCDLLNPAAQNLTASGGDNCGAMSNQRFGQNVLTSNYDPELLSGWGVRPSDWNYGVAVQQRLLDRVSVDLAYTRRTFRGNTATDNLLAGPGDYASYSITAPTDSRLPDGGGYVISGLLDIAPNLFGQVDNLITNAERFGSYSQHFDGVDFTLNARIRNGLTFQGGTSSGRTVADVCELRSNLPEFSGTIGAGLNGSSVSPTSPYCKVNYGVQTQFRGLASYVIPKVDIQLSSVFQSKPGPILAANYAVPAAEVARSLGRPPSGGVANVTVNLIEPGSMYGARVNQLDVRVAKLLRFSDRRAMLGVDIYNVANAGTILNYNTAWGSSWLRPAELMTGRLIRFSADFNF